MSDSRVDEIREAAHALVRGVAGLCDDVEVTIWRSDRCAFEVHSREVTPDLALGRVQVGIRVLRGGEMAMAATSTLDREVNLAAVKAALGGLRPSALPGFSQGDAPEAAWTWSDELARTAGDPRALRGLAASLRDRAYASPAAGRLESLEAALVYEERAVAHASRGGAGAYRCNGLMAWAEVNSAHAEYSWTGRGAPDREHIASLGTRALEALPSALVEPRDLGGPGEYEAVLEPMLCAGVLRSAAQEKWSGQSARAGFSRLSPGEAVFGPALTLFDAPVEPGLAGAAPFDDERTPTCRVPLAVGGKFQGFLYARETAALLGTQPTGSGWRHPVMIEDAAEAPIRERFQALVMEPGVRPVAELIGGMERGLVLFSLLGLHGADKARTTFSTAVSDGVAVKDGKIVGRLAPGAWNVSGRVLPGDGEPSMFGQAEPSLERVATGSSLLPWVRCRVQVG